jgi:hypothetical protein
MVVQMFHIIARSHGDRHGVTMKKNGYEPKKVFYDPNNPKYLPGSPTYIGPKK